MLTMKEAAEALDLSESTVSRAIAGKYADTPHGVFPLKFFFPSGGTAEFSNQAVTEKIKSLIKNENPASPLSDDALAELLKKEGISIARRTVAKYRDMLKIPSASKRKER
jgi:RNA polymerase sigma-54 factor